MNKPPGSVRLRSRRSDHALVQALMSLTLEKRFDAITVQQVLDRAEVGRTTFYTRYRGKDDLLVRSFCSMLGLLDQQLDVVPDGRVAPLRELFTHVRGFQSFHRALGRARKLDDLYRAGVDQLACSIGERLGPGAELRARGLAGAAMALLRWWLETGDRHTPDEMDALFHEMARA